MTTWEEYTSDPYFQRASDEEREQLRNQYWEQNIAPIVPMENWAEARGIFDTHTRPRGNPYQGYGGDLLDAVQQGFYSGVGGVVAGAEMMLGGDGDNAASRWLRDKADEQFDDMSPSGQRDMQNFGIEEDPNSPTGYGFKDEGNGWGFGLQLASGLGSLLSSMIPGGIAARGMGAVAKSKAMFDLANKAKAADHSLDAAKKLNKLEGRIDKGSQVLGYGGTGAAMIGAGGAEQAKQAIMEADYTELQNLPRFQELYSLAYREMGEQADTTEAARRARVQLAYEAADDAFGKSAAVGALSMGVGGPMMDKVARGVGTGSRIANSGKGAAIEGAQEYSEGYGQQVASNVAQQNMGMDVGTFDGAGAQALSGAIIGAPVGGVVGMRPGPQNADHIRTPLEDNLNNLYSQRETMEAQLLEPDAPREMLEGQLKENAFAIAALEQRLGSLPAARSQQPSEPPVDPAIDPGLTPQSWEDVANPKYRPPAGVTEFGQPLDAGQYDQPAYFRNGGAEPQLNTPQQEQQSPVLALPQPTQYANQQGQVGTDPQQVRQEGVRQQHPGYPQYSGNEEQDLQTYTQRVSGLNKVLRQFNWQPNQKAQRRQLKKVVDERRQIEKQARSQAKESPQQPYTPVNIVDRINEIKAAHAENRIEDFNRAVAELQADNLQERERLNGQGFDLSNPRNDSRVNNPAYRDYLDATASELEQEQVSEKRKSLKLQDDDSLITAIGKMGGLNAASVEDTVAESLDAHIKGKGLGLKGKYLKKSKGYTLDDMAMRLGEVGYTRNGRPMTAHDLSNAIEEEISGRPMFSERADYDQFNQQPLQAAASGNNRTAPAIRSALNGETVTGGQRQELARALESAEVDPYFNQPDYLSREAADIDRQRQDNALTDDWYDRFEPAALDYAEQITGLDSQTFTEADWQAIDQQLMLEDAAAHEQELNSETETDDQRQAGQSLRQSPEGVGTANRQESPETKEQRGSDADPQEEAPPLELQTQSEQELADKEAHQKEQQAKEQKENEQAEQKAKADRERKDFSLTGSDSASDANPDQGDLLGTGKNKPNGGVRYQLADDSRNLVALHNLSEDNLLFADELGGIPAPSLAITKKDQSFTGFGDITLVGDSGLINPAKNPVFDADVYSPRQPRAVHKISEKEYERVLNQFSDSFRDAENYESDRRLESLRSGWGDFVNFAKRDTPLLLAYLRSKGQNPRITKKKLRLESNRYVKSDNFYKWLKKNKPDYQNQDRLIEQIRRTFKEQDDALLAKGKSRMFVEDVAKMREESLFNDEGKLPFSKFTTFEDDHHKLRQPAKHRKNDVYALGTRLQNRLKTRKAKADFEQWLSDHFKNLQGELVTEKTYFTNAGDRRTKTTPYTLDAIARQMVNKGIRAGEGFNYGWGTARSMGAKQFRSVDGIRKEKDRLVSKDDMEAAKKELEDKAERLSESFRQYHPQRNEFGYLETFATAVGESYKLGAKRSLSENQFDSDVPDYLISEFKDFADELRKMPTEYFEAKMRRPVSLSEFKGAVVPKGVKPEVVEALKRNGINRIRYYKKGDDADRIRALGGFKNVFFKLSDEAYRYRKTKAKGMKSGPLKIKLAPLAKKIGVPVNVLQHETQLDSDLYQDVIRDGAQGRVRGLFDPDTNQAFVIADNLDNMQDAVRVVLHEVVGHKGLRTLTGKRLDTVLDQVYRDMDKRLAQSLRKRYRRQIEGRPAKEQQQIIAEEYIAHLAETDPQNGLLQKVISMIRNALRRWFPNMEWTAQDVVELIAASRKALRNNPNPNGPGDGPMFALRGKKPKTFKQRLATVLQAQNRVKPLVVGQTPDVLQLFGERNNKLTLAKRVITKSTRKDHAVPMEVIEQLPELLSDPELVFIGNKDDSYSLVVQAWEGDKQVMVAVNVKDSSIDSIHGRTKEQYSQYFAAGKLLYYKNENSLEMIGETEKSLSRSGKYAPDALVQFQGEAKRLSDSKRKVANYQTLIKFRNRKSSTRYSLDDDTDNSNYLFESSEGFNLERKGDVWTDGKRTFDADKDGWPRDDYGNTLTGQLKEKRQKKKDLRYSLGAYHGSPHDFDQFSTDHIGNGEGAQAYGWGLYFAGKKEVADHYKNALQQSSLKINGTPIRNQSGGHRDADQISELLEQEYDMNDRDAHTLALAIRRYDSKKDVMEHLHQKLISYEEYGTPETVDQFTRLRDRFAQMDITIERSETGSGYEVELAPNLEDMLHWDKPLNQQSKKLQAALKKADIPLYNTSHYDVMPDNNEGGTYLVHKVDPETGKAKQIASGVKASTMYEAAAKVAEPFESGQAIYDHVKKMFAYDQFDTYHKQIGHQYNRIPVDKAASLYLKKYGIPGIAYLNGVSRNQGEGDYNYVIFDDKDVTIKNRYALTPDLPGDVESVIKAIHGATTRKSWKDKVSDWLKAHPHLGTRKGWTQGLLDSFHSIEAMEREKNGGTLMEAAQSAYKAALRTKNLDGVMTALLGKGTPALENGSVVFRNGSKGFLEIFEPLAEKGEMELWETWAGSKRAMRLLQEGRENLYTPERIATIQNYVRTMPGMGQRFQRVFDDYQQFNSQVLDFAEQSGLIDPQSRKLWDNGDYIPFHRVHEVAGGEQESLFRKSGLSGQKSGIKKLTGGVEKISPLEAMYRNTQSLIDASFKNIAMQRIADVGVETDAMELTQSNIRLSNEDVLAKLADMGVDTNGITPEQMKRWKALLSKFTELGDGTVTVSRNGKTESYLVKDPLLLDAITELGPDNVNWLMKLMSIPKRLLTQLVTADPGFMVRNLFRDTLSTWMTVHPEINGKALKVNPVTAAIRTFNKKIDNDESRWALMMAGGGSGGFYDINPDNVRHKLSPTDLQRVIHKPGDLFNAWQKFGSRFENANRLHVYEQVLAQGGSVAEAAHQAQDVLNFTRKGQWAVMHFLVSSLPFFNARIQGLNRLWRGAKADGKSGWAGIAPSFLLRGTGYMAASMALLSMYEDDERYTSLPEWDKLTYHHFWLGDTHYRIPKPFEVGAIFGTLPEMIQQTTLGNEDMKWFRKMAGSMLFNTLAFDPVPQAFRPAMDIATNENSFTEAPIIPLGLQYVKPEAQFDPWTSETMKQIVKYVPESAPDWMRSPKKLQYLFQGYLGTLGRYALNATDVATRHGVGAASRPEMRIRDFPVAGSFVRDGVDATRYRTEMYEMQSELTDLVATINRYRDSGQEKEAKDLERSNRNKLTVRKNVNRYARRISKLRKEIRQIMDSRIMGAKTKRQRIDSLNQQMSRLSAEALRKYGGEFR